MTVFLVGGGPETVTPGLLAPFLDEVRAVAEQRGQRPSVVAVLLDRRGGGRRSFPAYLRTLGALGDVEVGAVLLRRGRELEARELAGGQGLVVGGGSTPEYRAGLIGAAGYVRAGVAADLPYLGFSAGAMIASRTALVGGHQLRGREVCPEEWSEGLTEVAVRPGLDVVPFTVDVHTAQAGTLPRTVALVGSGAVETAVGIDEGTCLAVPRPHSGPELGTVLGSGAVWTIRRTARGGVQVTRRTAD